MQSDTCRLCLHTPTQLNSLEEQSRRKAVHCSNSAIPDLLKTNDPPCSTRRREIESALDEQNARLAEIDATMARLQKTLAALFTERRQVQQRIVDYKMILHPIRRIPGDVLDEIFSWLVNEDGEDIDDEQECSYDPRAPIWLLPHVSRQWRDSALSFPRLWSTVRVDLSSPKPSERPVHAAFILGVQLQRSGRHPLSVSIFSEDDEFSSTDPILQALFPTSHRWQNLDLNIPIESFDAFRLLTTSFPLLRCLHLWVEEYEYDQIAESSLSTMFEFCPNLRELHGDPRSFSMMKIPFSQIRDLHSCRSLADSSTCLDALTRLPNLCDFSLSMHGDEDEMGIDHPEVTLPDLSSLALHRDKAGPIHLFRYLRSPSLINLVIVRLDCVCDLVPFLQRCKPLEFLLIESASLTDTDCIRVLEATPSLAEVVFECPLIYTTKFVSSLIGDGDSTPMLVPSLELFRVSGSAGFEDSQATRLKEARPELELTFDE